MAEISADNKPPFLETLVTFDNDSFSTDLFQKKPFTGLYFDFASFTPHVYKVNLVRSYLLSIVVYITNFLVLKAFLKKTPFLCLLLTKLLSLLLKAYCQIKVKSLTLMMINLFYF